MKDILNPELQNLAALYIGKDEQIQLSEKMGISVPKLRDILAGRTYCSGPQTDTIQGFVVMRHKLAVLKVNQISKAQESCP
jgi:hypothetical protein